MNPYIALTSLVVGFCIGRLIRRRRQKEAVVAEPGEVKIGYGTVVAKGGRGGTNGEGGKGGVAISLGKR